MASWFKLQPVIPVFHMNATVSPGCSTSAPLPVNALSKEVEDGTHTYLVPKYQGECPDEAPGWWLQPGSTLTVAAVMGNEPEDWKYVFLLLSFKIKKKIKDN